MNKNTIASIAEVNPPLPKYVGNKDTVSFITMADVSESGRLLRKSTKEFGDVKSGFTRFADNDVLFAKITPCMENGKGALVQNLTSGIGCGSTEFHVLRAKPKNSSAFIHQITKDIDFRIKAEMKMTGSAGQRRVPASFFNEHLIYIPSSPHQCKIARILTTVDNIIEKTESAREKYKAIKQGMMHDLFTRGIEVKTGKLSPSYENAPELYKETELGMIPKEWSVDVFQDITIKIADRDHFTPKYIDHGIPIISPKDFDINEKIDFSNCMYITEEAHNKNRLKTDLTINDLVFTIIGALSGKVCIVEKWMPEFSILHSSCMIRSDKNKVLPHYLLYFIKSTFLQIQMGQEIQSIGVPDLGLDKINAFKISYPNSMVEQKLLTNKIEIVFDMIEKEQTYLNKLKLIKQALMQDLLTGKVRVKPDEEDGDV